MYFFSIVLRYCVLCYGFENDKCLTLPFQPRLLLHPSMKLGYTRPRIVLLLLDPLQCSTSRPCPPPGVPVPRSPSCHNPPRPARLISNAASSVKLPLVPSGSVAPSLLLVPTVNRWHLFLAYFILPGGIQSCLYLFLPH